MGVSNLEARIKKLENTSQSEFGTPANTIFFPVRKLMLSEELNHDDSGVSYPVLVATWDKPAGVIFPESIRLIHNGTTVSLAGTATSYRMAGYAVGNTVTVNVTAIYAQGASSTVTAVKTITGDATPPSVPTNLTVAGGFRTLTLRWENPTAEDFSHIEIWESITDNNIATAERIAQAYGTEFVRSNCAVLETRWYWIRALDVNGNYSDFTSVASGTTTAIAMEDVSDGTITENMLISELASEINKIPAIEEDVNLINTVDLPAYEQRIANRIDEVNDGIMTQVNTYADGTIDAMLDASEAISAVRDAGIITDPATGTSSIFALDAYKTDNDARVSSVEVDLDAVESTLTSKVTLAQVDARIAGAVFGDVGELLLSGMDARVVTVEEGLDAVEGTLTEKASVVDVNALGGRIGTAESRLDGHDSEIALLATSQELDAVESRVSIAEVNIDALEGSIVNKVVSTVTVTQDEEELIAQGLVDAMLNDQEGKAETQEKSRTALAIAESELYAHIDDGLNAEAGERTLLAAQVAGNTSAIETVSTVVAGKARVYQQASAPTSGLNTGDLWIDNNGLIHRWQGFRWLDCKDKELSDLMNIAVAQQWLKVQATAGGKYAIAGIGVMADATTGSEIAMLADRFYLLSDVNGELQQPFAVDGATGKVVIDANLIVNGSITGEKIFAGARIQLADGGKLIIGEDGVIQIGSGAIVLDGATGQLSSTDPADVSTGDRLIISYGALQFLRYNQTEAAYEAYESIKAVAAGTCTSNEWVELPGVWLEPPTILVSPSLVMSYDSAYPTSDQYWSFYVKAVEEISPGSGVWRFLPIASLRIGDGREEHEAGFMRVIESFERFDSVVTVESDVETTPTGTTSIQLIGRMSSFAGMRVGNDLNDPLLQYKGTATLYYKKTTDPTYTQGETATLYFPASTAGVTKTWSLSALDLPSATYNIKVSLSMYREVDSPVYATLAYRTAFMSFDVFYAETLVDTMIRHGKLNWLAVAK